MQWEQPCASEPPVGLLLPGWTLRAGAGSSAGCGGFRSATQYLPFLGRPHALYSLNADIATPDALLLSSLPLCPLSADCGVVGLCAGGLALAACRRVCLLHLLQPGAPWLAPPPVVSAPLPSLPQEQAGCHPLHLVMMIWQLPAATSPPRHATLCTNIDCDALHRCAATAALVLAYT